MAGRTPSLARSAGACPPRAFDLRENRTPTKAVSRADRGMARDRPSPYGETETALHTVARGPSPAIRAGERVSPASARPTQKTHANQSRFPDRGTARDRPSPYGGREAALKTVARGPSDAIRASERVSPASVRSTRKTHANQPFPVPRRRDGFWVVKNSTSKEKSNMIYYACEETSWGVS